MKLDKTTIAKEMRSLQDRICKGLEEIDGSGKFLQDLWERPEGGGGRSRVISGQKIEKGGVNYSAVFGPTPEKILKALQLEKADFFATGVSIVLHPRNPHVPIIHMNVRYFEMSNGVYWFGGGIDLTPHYVKLDEAATFHSGLKSVCDQYDKSFYPKFKSWADEYFYIKHRKETRGVGGIFFDRLHEKSTTLTKNQLFQFVMDVGGSFVPLYRPLLQKNVKRTFTERERKWQLLRRGRYVEFNLVWDKGTKFGLDTDGRTESILMSMPPDAKWIYNFQVEKGSPEQETLEILSQKGKDYVST